MIGWLFVSKGAKNGQRSFSLFGLSFTAWYVAQFVIDVAFNPTVAYYANSALLLPASAIPFLCIRYGVLREIGKSRGEESRKLSRLLGLVVGQTAAASVRKPCQLTFVTVGPSLTPST